MSPTAFKDQVASFVLELTRCYDLCLTIRANRRLPSKTEALDALQSSLESGVQELQYEFNAIRRAHGSRMDLGDESARQALQKSIRELQSKIKVRLGDVAYKRNDSDVAGFRDLHRRYRSIEESVSVTIEALGRRIEVAKMTPAPMPEARPQPSRKTDEVTMTVKEFHRLTDHMRNSWTEKMVAGRLVFVNCLEESRVTSERPDGFVQYLPRSTRTKSWERQDARRPDSWYAPGGW